jgi:polar amino acid transport system ATP-binding protein
MNRGEIMVLNIQNLSKSFKGKEVLKNINMQLNKGEVLAVLGKSGAGKTTLIRCINGLEQCDGGTIEIDGMNLCKDKDGKSVYASTSELRNIRRNLGMVFQNFNLFPHMSVLENIIEAPINSLGIPKDEAQKSAIELLRLMELEDKVNCYPFELSGGQKQRVAIARACALNPKIICFDEPTSALDPQLTEDIASIIKNFAKTNMAVLIITHDMNFAKKVADRVMFIDKGEILKDASNEEFFENQKEDIIKKFILA